MKISFIGTYPPNQCGIGTFTNNLLRYAVSGNNDAVKMASADVIVINDKTPKEDYPPEVKYTVQKQDQLDYTKAADFINFSDSRLCVLQHEFGIFGGESGVYVLPLIHRLRVPLIVTFHTVLKNPSFLEKSIIREIGRKADMLIIMSRLGAEFLKEIYHIPEENIRLIEHGVPEFNINLINKAKKKFNYENKKVLLTFGLLGRNKGIETVINALPRVVKKHPEVMYLVLGTTHPNILLHSGEQYRQYLKLLVRKYHLENHVFFLKQFVGEKTLLQYLSATDIYITPYLNESQITSGTLSYAIGAGAACVSTPYWHANELLSDGRGVLFDFKDSAKLSDIIIDLLDNPEKLKVLKSRAYEYGKNIRWSIIGAKYQKLFKKVVKAYRPQDEVSKMIIDPTLVPRLNLSHLIRLTDDTGIVQHAKFGIPNLKEGYCLDDNARALLAALIIYRRTKNKEALDLIPIYFSYIHYMQNIKGSFRNFMSFDRRYLDEEGSEDSFGRTIWALGYMIRYSPNDAYFQLATELFRKAHHNFEQLNSVRGIANTLIGLCYYIHHFQSDEEMINLMERMSFNLVERYYNHRTKDWHWFEDILTYDNGVIPQALYHTVQIIDNAEILKVAEESTRFLEKVTLKDGYYAPVGSNGWFPKGGVCARYPQQATDAMIMISLYFKVYQIKKRKRDLKNMFQCFTWFLGENDLRIPLYDHETNGCNDGLESYGVNRNQGAESTLAYLISNMNVLNALELESKISKQIKLEKSNVMSAKIRKTGKKIADPNHNGQLESAT